jgi:hypothetical protein
VVKQYRTKADVMANDYLRDLFEERAAIREFDGGHKRSLAETLALHDVKRFINERRAR